MVSYPGFVRENLAYFSAETDLTGRYMVLFNLYIVPEEMISAKKFSQRQSSVLCPIPMQFLFEEVRLIRVEARTLKPEFIF
jgi:hypothetical protein